MNSLQRPHGGRTVTVLTPQIAAIFDMRRSPAVTIAVMG